MVTVNGAVIVTEYLMRTRLAVASQKTPTGLACLLPRYGFKTYRKVFQENISLEVALKVAGLPISLSYPIKQG